MKKIVSLLLSVVMMLSLVSATAFAATGTATVYLQSTAAGTTINPGDTFTVECRFPDPSTFTGVKAGLYFDTSLFEVTKLSSGTVTYYDEESEEDATWATTAKSTKTTANETGIITYTYAGTSEVEYSGGRFFTVTFAAKDVSKDTTYTFKIAEQNNLTGYKIYNAEEAPDSTVSVTIKAAAPVLDEEKTVTGGTLDDAAKTKTYELTVGADLKDTGVTAVLKHEDYPEDPQEVGLTFSGWAGEAKAVFNVVVKFLDYTANASKVSLSIK